MIVDTSALVAVARDEEDRLSISEALLAVPSLIPAPVMVEFRRVTARAGNELDPHAESLLSAYLQGHASVEPFTAEDAEHAAAANQTHGRGNGRGGKLNLLDLMVYGMAKRTGRPVLCTGRDFAATDIPIHPASRLW